MLLKIEGEILKKIAICAAAVFMNGACFSADHYVNGYTRQNGTYVQPHHQTAPNQYRYDNYSSQGNVNPYTGQAGTQRNEYSNPPAYNQGYRGIQPGYGSSAGYGK